MGGSIQFQQVLSSRQLSRRSLGPRIFALVILACFLSISAAEADPAGYLTKNAKAMRKAGNHLFFQQLPNGAMPGEFGDPTVVESNQGLSGMGLLSVYKATGRDHLIDDGRGGGAVGVRDWLWDYHIASPTNYMSAPSIFFLAEYALLTGTLADMHFAREAFDRLVDDFGPADNLARDLIGAHHAAGTGSYVFLELGLLIRAGHDVGRSYDSGRFLGLVQHQNLINPFDKTADGYEFGLAGIIMGISEDVVPHHYNLDEVPKQSNDWYERHELYLDAQAALLETQCEDRSFPLTTNGVSQCGHPFATALAVLALASTLQAQVHFGPLIECTPNLYHPCLAMEGMHAGCRHLRDTQRDRAIVGWWRMPDGRQLMPVNGAAAMALAACEIFPSENIADSIVEVVYAPAIRFDKTQSVASSLLPCVEGQGLSDSLCQVDDITFERMEAARQTISSSG